jgi:hypothetical protein
MNLVMLGGFEDEMIKIAAGRADVLKAFAKKPEVAGAALTGSLGALSNVRSEMKRRNDEDSSGKTPEELKKARGARLKRLGISTAASAGTGALLGFAGKKGVAALKDAGKKGLEAIKTTASETAHDAADKAGKKLNEHAKDATRGLLRRIFHRNPKG